MASSQHSNVFENHTFEDRITKNETNDSDVIDNGEAVISIYCTKIDKNFANASKFLRQHGYQITPEKAHLLWEHAVHNRSVGVLDIRDPDVWDSDLYNFKIPGAVDYPLPETLRLPELLQDLGQRLEDEPFVSLLKKPVLIVYCRASFYRTPTFASIYVKTIPDSAKQYVVLLQGGFEAYLKAAKANDWELEERRKP
ncbi:hypothetical protein CPB83DRAFT_847696 [Crepidotus variabilis]|uniref:Rhodanese domain-containing protein n=1 Tax=Crepidotus variabilis TaxID=179855 RepID=A0A9P6ENT8_9AGAR|nr:hypothetical protein CPB83DRAFT_847696 [Crepidotus variabilis]